MVKNSYPNPCGTQKRQLKLVLTLKSFFSKERRNGQTFCYTFSKGKAFQVLKNSYPKSKCSKYKTYSYNFLSKTILKSQSYQISSKNYSVDYCILSV